VSGNNEALKDLPTVRALTSGLLLTILIGPWFSQSAVAISGTGSSDFQHRLTVTGHDEKNNTVGFGNILLHEFLRQHRTNVIVIISCDDT
jgi:hypothetical protein